MALDTYAALAAAVQARCPVAGILLARQFVSHAFRRVAEKRRWSWLTKRAQFIFPAVVNAGTITATNNSNSIAGVGTAFTAAMIGRQFRVSGTTPIYTISAVTDAVTLTLEDVYGGATVAGVTYEIFLAYATVPSDFHSFISVTDPSMNWRLWANVYTQADLDWWDAQRAYAGNSYAVVFRDYDTTSSPPLARYEFWPHRKALYVFPYLYEMRAADLEDSGATLPRFIRGDVLLELALAEASAWPGGEGRKNPMFKLELALYHDRRAQAMIAELEKQDDEVWEQDVTYTRNIPMAPHPFDSAWLQRHDFPY